MRGTQEIGRVISDEDIIRAIVPGDHSLVKRCEAVGLSGEQLVRAVHLVGNIKMPFQLIVSWSEGGIMLEQMPTMFEIVRDLRAKPRQVMQLVRSGYAPEAVSTAYIIQREGALRKRSSVSLILLWLSEISSGTQGAVIGSTVDMYLEFVNDVAERLGGASPSHRLYHAVRAIYPGGGIHTAFAKYADTPEVFVDIIRRHAQLGDGQTIIPGRDDLYYEGDEGGEDYE